MLNFYLMREKGMRGNIGKMNNKGRQKLERTAKFSCWASILIAVAGVCTIVYASSTIINAVVFSVLFLAASRSLFVFGAAIGVDLALDENTRFCASCGDFIKNGSLCDECEDEISVKE